MKCVSPLFSWDLGGTVLRNIIFFSGLREKGGRGVPYVAGFLSFAGMAQRATCAA